MTPDEQYSAVIAAIRVLDNPTVQLTVYCRDCWAPETEHLGWVDDVWVGCVCPDAGFGCECREFKPGTSDRAQRDAAIDGLRELREHMSEIRAAHKDKTALVLLPSGQA